jgi:4-carboxymuconolactone decarboxylase
MSSAPSQKCDARGTSTSHTVPSASWRRRSSRDSAFERRAHEAVGRATGLTDEELRSLRDGEQPRLDDPAEQAALDVVRALLADGDIAGPLFQRAASSIGNQAVVELTSLVGYYATLALQLRVFRVRLPAELPGELPGESA